MDLSLMKRTFTYSETTNENDSDAENVPPPQPRTKIFRPFADCLVESPKKTSINTNQFENFSDKSIQMMQKMGFTGETGLGKQGQGRIEPIEASIQKGRRGFGYKLEGLDLAATKWTPDMEKIELHETVTFISDSSDDLETKSSGELQAWMVVGPKKLSIEKETKFCLPFVLRNVLASKSLFDKLGTDDMRNARSRSNPFETISNAIFMNRAGVKMANLDAVCDWMFTNPVDEAGQSLVKENELLYFADVCAGPGGFSEYVLWRKQWHAKGFGFTLRNENDFKLDQFWAGHPETFDTFYGIKEDGNVYDPENILSFSQHVLNRTPMGVHFMMSDGGFSVEGQENVQEILSKQLYLCQCLTALTIVRVDGHFVTKLFDLFTPFSVGLIYLMYKCFKKISIIKPNTSRPANSERYLVCKWKKLNTDAIQQYLFDVNVHLHDNRNTDSDINELVPFEVMKKDETFYNYICESNNVIGDNQVVALLKIAHFSKNTNLHEPKQEALKNELLDIWRVPNEIRRAPTKPSTDQILRTLMDTWYADRQTLFNAIERNLTHNTDFENLFFDRSDWAFVPVNVDRNSGKSVRTFFMSKGNSDVYKYSIRRGWEPLIGIFIEIPPNTLFYGETVKELVGEGCAQTMIYAIHVIDGIVLGGMNIRNFKLEKRNELCRKFVESVNKAHKKMGVRNGTNIYVAPLRCKTLYPLLDMRPFFESLNNYQRKDWKVRVGIRVNDILNPEQFYFPHGLLLLKILKPNICKRHDQQRQEFRYTDTSRTPNKHFYLNEIPDPEMVYSSFRTTYQHRKLWKWEDPRQVLKTVVDEENTDPDLIFRDYFEQFIYRKYRLIYRKKEN
ncbi:cap-specific mRNA (nucleoside-2'-O-)-methyltransferase 1-like [Contarinia nasturtii]|uniref:cap-specific mRNA (nucleoside-2'-O-)-methyltransferase 1-like n=1 Tax=Contarinia nasturtii TaxID=265458 RepID=UPI0012D3F5D1|nr:cap-specific mRNA (nucleoside-2'-O-)-methyltransferase 1-like [Contarinia nasturtii]